LQQAILPFQLSRLAGYGTRCHEQQAARVIFHASEIFFYKGGRASRPALTTNACSKCGVSRHQSRGEHKLIQNLVILVVSFFDTLFAKFLETSLAYGARQGTLSFSFHNGNELPVALFPRTIQDFQTRATCFQNTVNFKAFKSL